MSETFAIECREQEGCVILGITGYFGESAGDLLTTYVEENLCQGKGKMVIDLSRCKVLSSPGIGALIEIVDKIVEDFDGSLVFSGPDPVMLKVLNLTHVTRLAPALQTLPEALKHLKKDA